MAKNHLTILNDLFPDAVQTENDPFVEGIRSSSPSVNFIMGNTHLIPFGASAIFWGKPKAGKSLLINNMIGQLHKDYPDAVVLKYNTEMREHFQMTDLTRKVMGIDKNRYKAFNTNKPDEIFDHIEQMVPKAIEKGLNIKCIVIDSITDILGRRAINADTVNTMQMGDDAATQAAGLKRIKSIIRKYNIALLLVCQERAVLDPVEVMRGKKVKMAGAYYLQHFAEYFIYVAPNEAAEGKVDLLGQKFENKESTDVMGNAEQTAFKTKVTMSASTVGIAKRTGEFTFNKYKGFINIHEEAFRLGVARNIFDRPNLRTYVLKNWPEEGKESKWTSKEDCLIALNRDEDLQKEIVKRVRMIDMDAAKNGIADAAIDVTSEAGVEAATLPDFTESFGE